MTNLSDLVKGSRGFQGYQGESVNFAWSTEVSSATPTINTDAVQAHSITALATGITSMTENLTGTPDNFQRLIIRIKDNGVERVIIWGTAFESKGPSLPTLTVPNKVLTAGFEYDSITSKWGCVAVIQEN